jgi:hypothetical protein
MSRKKMTMVYFGHIIEENRHRLSGKMAGFSISAGHV